MSGQLPHVEYIRGSAREQLVRDLVDAGIRVERLPGESRLGEKFRCSLRDATIPLWFDRSVSSPDHIAVLLGDAPFWSWLWRRDQYAALFAKLDRVLDAHALSFAVNRDGAPTLRNSTDA